MGLRWRQAQGSLGRVTELSMVRQARMDGLHLYQRQSHRVRFDLLERRPLQTASRFRCPVGRRSQRHQCPHPIQNRKQREDGPDRYLALRLRTSPEGNTRHQEHAASGRADFLQAASLVTWLTQKVSLIRGPPGEFLRTGYASSTRI